MGTSIVRFAAAAADSPRWGVLRGERIHPLALEAAGHRDLMREYCANRPGFDARIAADSVALAEVNLYAPLSRDIQLLCQGFNYADHREEGGLKDISPQEESLVFMKAASTICNPNETIIRPRGCQLLDYEIELGLVLKADVVGATTVSERDLGPLIGGLVLANDVSARDLQFGAPMMQWFKGKSFRTFCPTGPVLYLLDDGDLDQLYKLELTLKLNGTVKQHATTDLLIHKPAKTLTELSAYIDMYAGDCILTGTPGGVLAGTSLKAGLALMLNMKNDQKRRRKFVEAQLARTKFLLPGDILELEIKSLDGSINLGTQRNEIVDA